MLADFQFVIFCRETVKLIAIGNSPVNAGKLFLLL
jgi:hypothetical protein